jgi:hypothetical protein
MFSGLPYLYGLKQWDYLDLLGTENLVIKRACTDAQRLVDPIINSEAMVGVLYMCVHLVHVQFFAWLHPQL